MRQRRWDKIVRENCTDLDFLKKKVIEIEENINMDMHHVKPEYIKKLEAIKKEGTVSSAEFEKKFSVKI